MTKKRREIIPRSVISKLLNIIVIALGNVLIVAGESLIRYGKDNINALVEEEKKSKEPLLDSDDFFGL